MNLVGWALEALIVVGVLAALVVALVLAVRRAPLSPRAWIALSTTAVVLQVLTELGFTLLLGPVTGGAVTSPALRPLLCTLCMVCAGVFLVLSTGKRRLLKLLLLLPALLFELAGLVVNLVVGYASPVYVIMDMGMVLVPVLLFVWYASNRSLGVGIPMAMLALPWIAWCIWGRYFGVQVLNASNASSELSRLFRSFAFGWSPSVFLLLLLTGQAGLLSAKLRATAPAQPAKPAQPATSAARFCVHCGAPVSAPSRFCTRCGRPL